MWFYRFHLREYFLVAERIRQPDSSTRPDDIQVRSASTSFTEYVNREVCEFVDRLRQDSNQIGTVCLEFFSKKRKNWAFSDDVLKWEIWTIRVDCVSPFRQRVEEVLMEKVLTIIQIVNNSNSYLPPMPSERYLSSVFETSFPDVQPYLHKVSINSWSFWRWY